MARTKQKTKTLTLSKDKKLLGVAGGVAEYFGIDKAWTRIVALLLIVFSGIIPGLLLYFIIGSVIIPEKTR